MKTLIISSVVIIIPMSFIAYSNNAALHDNVNFTAEVLREAKQSI